MSGPARVLLSWAGAWALLLCGCAEGIVVELHNTFVDAAPGSLRITPAIEGQPARWSGQTVTEVLDTVLLDLPGDLRGRLVVQVSGLDAKGCLVAAGQGAQELKSSGRYTLDVTVKGQAQAGCRLVIDRIGQGKGTVRAAPASPAAGSCPATGPCELPFPPGTGLTLVPEPAPDSLFAGWSGACAGTAPCTLQTGEGRTLVRASFARKQVCTRSGFCWENPRPQGMEVTALWGTSAQDIWAVGVSGAVLHYNGSFWTALDSGTDNNLYGIWGRGADDIWIGGEKGTVLHFDGERFTAVPTGDTRSIAAVHGNSAGELWMAGNAGLLLHQDREGGAPAAVDVTFGERVVSANFHGVWSSGPGEVWIVGDKGLVLRYDGARFTGIDSGVNTPLKAIWGSGGPAEREAGCGELWVSSLSDGRLLRWRGGGFTTVESGSPYGVNALFGLAAPAGPCPGGLGELWAASRYGILQRFDGQAWHGVTTARGTDLQGLWGSGPGDMWGGGQGDLLHFNGAFVDKASSGSQPDYIFSLAGAAPQDLWATTSDGLLHYDGVAWVPWIDTQGLDPRLSGLLSLPNGEVWAAGAPNSLWRFDGRSWQLMTQAPEQGGLSSLWGLRSDDLWAVGSSGHIYHYDGRAMKLLDSGTTSYLFSVAGCAPDDVWVGGDAGTLLHYDGATWQPLTLDFPPGQMETLSFQQVACPGGKEAWAVGATDNLKGFVILRDLGGSADEIGRLCRSCNVAFGVWGRAPNDVYVVGPGVAPALQHWDGTRFQPLGDLPRGLNGVWGLGQDHVFATGPYGFILHLDRGAGGQP